MANFVPSGQYGTVTKEENVPFSTLRNPESSQHRLFPSGYSDPSDPRKRIEGGEISLKGLGKDIRVIIC